MAYPKYAQIKGGKSQVESIYKCPNCEMYGQGNKMLYHIKICDGTGIKNYWSKKNSELLRMLLSNLF